MPGSAVAQWSRAALVRRARSTMPGVREHALQTTRRLRPLVGLLAVSGRRHCSDGRTVGYDRIEVSAAGGDLDSCVLDDYVEQFKRLRVNKARGEEMVHKPCMLLAVIDLAERGGLGDNRIRYEETLEGFQAYAEVVRPNSRLDAFFPFEHLRTSTFWLADRDDPIRPSHGRMLGRSAALGPELHRLICCDMRAREQLRQALIERWFPEQHAAVWELVRQRQLPNEYEKDLRSAGAPIKADQGVTSAARSGTFRRLVLEAYDYRCAATGWRVLLPGPRALVEAAHLIPWGESHDDRPSNGIALTPTYHRALDWHLIAPGPDMKWRVSRALDKRIPDNQGFLALAGEDVIFHGVRHRPLQEALEWRVAHLLGA